MSVNGVMSVVWHRTAVLVMLLLLQSLSQIILESYEGLISSHVIIPLFLTMLVGAGGNAGNQSTVRSITGLVTGEFAPRDFWKVLRKELVVGILNASILATIGFARVYYFYGHRNLYYSTIAITASLFCIVFISVVLGTVLPFALGFVGLNREHAAPVIQVVMDIVGVLVTCSLCYRIIPDSEHTSHDHDAKPAGA
jgi:Mg/Co/Ni transporter MgtE